MFLTTIFALAVASTPVSSCPATPYGVPTMVNQENMIQICHTGYYTDYSTTNKLPEVVGWTIDSKNVINCNSRRGKFTQDPEADGKDAAPSTYTSSGFDRGHLADAEDFAYNRELQAQSFYMTNMTPQLPGLNRGGWKWLETASRYWAYEYGKVVVYDGVITKNSEVKLDNEVVVPTQFWKVVYIPSLNKAIAVVVPNVKISGKEILNYTTSVANIEEMASVNIPLPTNVDKTTVESGQNWIVKAGELTKLKSNQCSVER